MKKLAFPALLALALAIGGCGNSSLSSSTTTTTATSGNWEAVLTGGEATGQGLSFVTSFSVTDVSGNNESLDITGFGFINSGSCFTTGYQNENVSGTASFATNTGTDQVTGQMTFIVQSIVPAGNTLTLTSPPGGLTGTSTGTTTTTGTLTNGVVQGTWTLSPGPQTPNCSGTGNFLMCQGTATCTIP
jgi:hypothetical protein